LLNRKTIFLSCVRTRLSSLGQYVRLASLSDIHNIVLTQEHDINFSKAIGNGGRGDVCFFLQQNLSKTTCRDERTKFYYFWEERKLLFWYLRWGQCDQTSRAKSRPILAPNAGNDVDCRFLNENPKEYFDNFLATHSLTTSEEPLKFHFTQVASTRAIFFIQSVR